LRQKKSVVGIFEGTQGKKTTSREFTKKSSFNYRKREGGSHTKNPIPSSTVSKRRKERELTVGGGEQASRSGRRMGYTGKYVLGKFRKESNASAYAGNLQEGGGA